jgi:hypothetical protein
MSTRGEAENTLGFTNGTFGMLAAMSSPVRTTRRPLIVVVAVSLLVVDALLGAVSPHVLFHLSPSSKGWVLPFQPGVWLLALFQLLFAAMVWRGKRVLRYLLAAWVAYLLVDGVAFTSLNARIEHFPWATARDALSFSLLTLSAVLLFLPSSSEWFNHTRPRGEA